MAKLQVEKIDIHGSEVLRIHDQNNTVATYDGIYVQFKDTRTSDKVAFSLIKDVIEVIEEECPLYIPIAKHILDCVDELNKLVDHKWNNENLLPSVKQLVHDLITMIDELVEKLYQCSENRNIKTIAVVLKSQLNKAKWKQKHLSFLKEVMTYMMDKSTIDENDANLIWDMIKKHGLNPYRGTLSGL